MHRIFVYGTLKQHRGNHALLENCTDFFIDAATVNTYRMLLAGFPVILDDPEGRPVCGELYHVDDKTLARLDRLEGVRGESGMYVRKTTRVTLPLANGQRMLSDQPAFLYVGGPRWASSGCPVSTNLNARGELVWGGRDDESSQ